MATISTTDLTNSSITDNIVTGTGVFDDLMEAVNTHLDAQFKLGRLSGTDYATVYLGAIQSSLQNSVQFVLGKQQADKQADLLEAQTIAATQQKDIDILLKRQQIMTESLGNGLAVTEYIWTVTYTENTLGSYTYVTNQELSKDDVKALMIAGPHVEDYTVNTVALTTSNILHEKGTSSASAKVDLVEAQTTQVTSQTTSDTLLKNQQIINETLSNGLEIKEYTWGVVYEGDTHTYPYITNQNLTPDHVEALMTANPHREDYIVDEATLSDTITIYESGTSLAVAKTEILDKQALTEVKKALDLANQTTNRTSAQTTNEDTAEKQRNLISAQTVQVSTQTISEKLSSKENVYLTEQQIITGMISNGEEINQYIWEVNYTLVGQTQQTDTYTFTTIQNLTENDVKAILNYDPHVEGGVVTNISLSNVNRVRDKSESVSGANIKKTQRESEVLNQKRVTEFAQTYQDSITKADGSTAVADTNSIIGKQNTLFTQQAAGFKWDAQNTHNKNRIDLQKMKINVSGYVSPQVDTNGDVTNEVDASKAFTIDNPLTDVDESVAAESVETV